MPAILSIHSDAGMTLTALAAQLGMRQSNTSAVVGGLVERGLVRGCPYVLSQAIFSSGMS
ncbi:MarR family transcriptional regulator [Glutamicibacter sp. NPDC087831]|uniref:MarR family transcriptional regulator n=1 Tax=Glutamicibacter sp. NPDC087831 TaxID=3363998 RepID=UPI0038078ACC